MKNNFITVVLISLIFLALPVLAHTGEDGYSHHSGFGMMDGSYGVFPIAFGWLIWLLFIVVLVLAIVWLIKQIQKK